MRTLLLPALKIGWVVLCFSLALVMENLQWGDNIATGRLSLPQRVDARVYDFALRARNQHLSQPISRSVTLMGIDNASIRRLGRYGSGQWLTRRPFRKQLLAAQAYRPSVIAYDLLLAPAASTLSRDGQQAATNAFDTESLWQHSVEVVETLKQPQGFQTHFLDQDGLDIIREQKLQDLMSVATTQSDVRLAWAIEGLEETDVLLAYAFDRHEASQESQLTAILGPDPDDYHEDNGTVMPFLLDVSIPLEWVHRMPADAHWWPQLDPPSNRLLDYAQLGYINVPRDEDGVVRRYPLVAGFQYSWTWPSGPNKGKLEQRRLVLPSLGLLACLSHWGIDLYDAKQAQTEQPPIEVHFGSHVLIRPPGRLPRTIPIDERGNLYVNFVGDTRDFQSVTFLDGNEPAATPRIRNRMVFVGQTFTGAQDVGPTSISHYTPLVAVHTNIASNLMTNDFLRLMPLRTRLFTIIGLGCALILSLFLRPASASSATFLLIAGYAALFALQLIGDGLLLPVSAPLAAAGLSFFGIVYIYYITEVRERRKIRTTFAPMVSDEVLTYIQDNPDSIDNPEQREATMFFSDIAGFTNISERLTTVELVDLLNQYLSPMTEIIRASKGLVDKFEGDAIMAEWGVPYPDPNHATAACWAALDQQARLAELRPRFERDFGVTLHVRMGLHSGECHAALMGSENRRNYTVMGDTVNIAARLEPANKSYGTEICIGEATYQAAKDDIDARLLDKIVVVGKSIPICIYELVARKGQRDPEQATIHELYERGLALHWERNWEDALACFDKALAIDPDDNPSKALRTRVLQYQQQPPPESWNGAYVRTSK